MSHGLSTILRLLILTTPVLLFQCSESNFKGTDKKIAAPKKAAVNKVDVDSTPPIEPPGGPLDGGDGNADKPCTEDCTAPAPTANLLVNGSNVNITIPYNTAPSVTWTSTNTTTCKLTGGPPCDTGSPPAACSELNHAGLSTGNLTATKTYLLTCEGSATVTKQIEVAVNAAGCGSTGISPGFRYDNSCFYLSYDKDKSLATSPPNPYTCTQRCSAHGGSKPRTADAATCTIIISALANYTAFHMLFPIRSDGKLSTGWGIIKSPFHPLQTPGICGMRGMAKGAAFEFLHATVMPNYNLPTYSGMFHVCACNN